MNIVRYGVFLPGMLIAAITGLGAIIWPTVTHVETGKTSQYSDIQPQFLPVDAPTIVRSLEETVADTPRLRFDPDYQIQESATNAELVLHAKGPVLPTNTQVRVTVHRSNSGRSVVHMRANGTGGGKTDFGQWARNIRYLQQQIDQRTRTPHPHAERP